MCRGVRPFRLDGLSGGGVYHVDKCAVSAWGVICLTMRQMCGITGPHIPDHRRRPLAARPPRPRSSRRNVARARPFRSGEGSSVKSGSAGTRINLGGRRTRKSPRKWPQALGHQINPGYRRGQPRHPTRKRRGGSKYNGVPTAQSGTAAGTASSVLNSGTTFDTSRGSTVAMSMPCGSSLARNR